MYFSGGPYFQRAILQSGSALSTWAVAADPITCTHKLAANVNCSHAINDSEALLACLRNKSVEELVKHAPKAPKYHSCFGPTVGSGREIFPRPVKELLKHRPSTFSKSQMMFGITKNEAYSYLKQHELEHGISEQRKTQIIRTYVHNVFRYHRQKIFEILDHQYSEWDKPQDEKSRMENVMQLISDGQYVAPLVEMGQYHSRFNDTFFYSFSYSTQSVKFPKWSSGVHGDELPYIFGAPLVEGLSPFPSDYNSAEIAISEAMMRFWSNFAKSGYVYINIEFLIFFFETSNLNMFNYIIVT